MSLASPLPRVASFILTVFLGGVLFACDTQQEAAKVAVNDSEIKSDPRIDTAAATQVLFDTGAQALASSQSQAAMLADSVNDFLSQPSQEGLEQAQRQWQQTLLAYRGFTAPAQISIADADMFKQLNRLDYQIASFPIQPGFLDKFGPHKYSGIVHDIGMEISEESLTAQHGLTDLSEAVLGLYPLEFMLYDRGQARKIDDFTKISSLNKELRERGFEQLVEVPNNRRRVLLQKQLEVLQNNLNTLSDIWQGPAASTRSIWDTLSDEEKIALAQESYSAGLTRLMLEVSELNTEVSDDENFEATISPAVKDADFAFQQNFVIQALSSVASLGGFYPPQKQTQLEELLKAVKELTLAEDDEAGKSEKDYWREVFSLIKRASDLSHGNSTMNNSSTSAIKEKSTATENRNAADE